MGLGDQLGMKTQLSFSMNFSLHSGSWSQSLNHNCCQVHTSPVRLLAQLSRATPGSHVIPMAGKDQPSTLRQKTQVSTYNTGLGGARGPPQPCSP